MGITQSHLTARARPARDCAAKGRDPIGQSTRHAGRRAEPQQQVRVIGLQPGGGREHVRCGGRPAEAQQRRRHNVVKRDRCRPCVQERGQPGQRIGRAAGGQERLGLGAGLAQLIGWRRGGVERAQRRARPAVARIAPDQIGQHRHGLRPPALPAILPRLAQRLFDRTPHPCLLPRCGKTGPGKLRIA
jgi:hypothetical protein